MKAELREGILHAYLEDDKCAAEDFHPFKATAYPDGNVEVWWHDGEENSRKGMKVRLPPCASRHLHGLFSDSLRWSPVITLM